MSRSKRSTNRSSPPSRPALVNPLPLPSPPFSVPPFTQATLPSSLSLSFSRNNRPPPKRAVVSLCLWVSSQPCSHVFSRGRGEAEGRNKDGENLGRGGGGRKERRRKFKVLREERERKEENGGIGRGIVDGSGEGAGDEGDEGEGERSV